MINLTFELLECVPIVIDKYNNMIGLNHCALKILHFVKYHYTELQNVRIICLPYFIGYADVNFLEL